MTAIEVGCDISPTTDSIIADINRENMTWESALGDLIDNSFDANASRVVIEIDQRSPKHRCVIVRDNGDGCAEVGSMLRQGYSTKRGKRNMLGRYGVGLKHASYWFCGDSGRTVIVSRCGSESRKVRVCWGDVVRSGAWQIPPVEMLADADASPSLLDGRGTTVTFDSSRRRWLSGPDSEKLLKQFGFVFAPALRSGRQIEFVVGSKRQVVKFADDPKWSESVEAEIVIGNRRARLRAGIKSPTDASGMSGMSFTYGHRVIVANESDGLGDYSRHGFAGIVDLDEHWVLGQNKQSVTDDAWEQLCAEIHGRIRPMLEKLRNSSLAMRMDGLRASVAAILGGDEKLVQPSGWHRKKGGPPRTRKADGPRPKSAGSVKVDFYRDPDERRAGYVESNGRCIQINGAKLLTAAAIDDGDSKFLALLARGLWSNSDAKKMLPGDARDAVYEDLLGDFCAKPVQMVTMAAVAQ